MYGCCDIDNVQVSWSQVIFIPRSQLIGPRLVILNCNLISSLNTLMSTFDNPVMVQSSTCDVRMSRSTPIV